MGSLMKSSWVVIPVTSINQYCQKYAWYYNNNSVYAYVFKVGRYNKHY